MTLTNFQNDELEEPLRALHRNGFCVVNGYIPFSKMPELSAAYDRAVASAPLENISEAVVRRVSEACRLNRSLAHYTKARHYTQPPGRPSAPQPLLPF